jgi:predicted dinucleotide-binding enzyme
MKIAVIGAGNVGGTLGKRWSRAGHEVAFGTRDPADAKVSALVRESGPSARAASVPEAVRPAAVVVLTVPWDNAREALTAAGDLRGRILIDATNPVPLTPEGLRQGLVIGHTTSGAEEIAGWAPCARVVKAFKRAGPARAKHRRNRGIAKRMQKKRRETGTGNRSASYYR